MAKHILGAEIVFLAGDVVKVDQLVPGIIIFHLAKQRLGIVVNEVLAPLPADTQAGSRIEHSAAVLKLICFLTLFFDIAQTTRFWRSRWHSAAISHARRSRR